MDRRGERHRPGRPDPSWGQGTPGERRRAATRESVRQAVAQLLTSGGYGQLTYERVAAESGVAKTTLYRHWPTKAELVFDLVLRERELPALAATGTAAGDVAALAARLAEFLGGSSVRPVFAGVVADLVADPLLLQRFQEEFVVAAQPLLGEVCSRIAQAREARSSLPIADLQAVLLGSAFFWSYLAGLPVDQVQARIVALVDALFPEP